LTGLPTATQPQVRLTREGEQIFRVWLDDEHVGTVVATADGWTARLAPPRDSRWAWAAPQRRDAVAGLITHLWDRDKKARP
jgi:hypothetical protein